MPQVIRNDFFLVDNSGDTGKYICCYFQNKLDILALYIVDIRKMPNGLQFIKAFISQRSMSNGFIYVVDAHFIDKIEEENILDPSACGID